VSSFLRSIRARGPWWVLLLCTAFLLSAPVLAQDEDPTPKQQLADIDSSLKDVERKRGDAEAIETLAMLSENASQARRDAEALEKALQPQLDRSTNSWRSWARLPKAPPSRRNWRRNGAPSPNSATAWPRR
jgi:small-conductance mechanosensitive channel